MRKGENFNRPQKGSQIKVDPIRKKRDKPMEGCRDTLLWQVGFPYFPEEIGLHYDVITGHALDMITQSN